MFGPRESAVLLKWTCCPIHSCLLNQAHFQLKKNKEKKKKERSESKFGQEIEDYIIFYSSWFYTDLLHK